MVDLGKRQALTYESMGDIMEAEAEVVHQVKRRWAAMKLQKVYGVWQVDV